MEEDFKIMVSERQVSFQPKRLTSNELLMVFEEEMKVSSTFKFVGEAKNPCHIMFEGVEFYVYIKNLSSAYFANPDVSRAQMTGVDVLLEIQKTDALFVLLGYDADNHVFAAWNPHVAKQRIGTASSPSLYSRFSWQKEAKEQRFFITRELKNEGRVILFPKDNLSLFLGNIDVFFPDTSEYVAMGSKRRIEANAAYRELTDQHHLGRFAKYLIDLGYDQFSVQKFVRAIKQLIKSSFFSNHRKIFLACDSLIEYRDVVQEFLSLDEIKKLDVEQENSFSEALPVYVDFLINEYCLEETVAGEEKEDDEEMSESAAENSEKQEEEENDATTESVDYETRFTDEQGRLTCIANPKLINLLREDLDKEYPSLFGAYSTVEDFYGDRFPNMEMHHWLSLFKKIDWQNPYPSLDSTQSTIQRKRTTRLKIRVVKPNGDIIFENQVVNTLLEVIKLAGVEEVRDLNITMGKNGGLPLISSEIVPKYANAFKELGNGLYLNSCSDTNTKFLQIKKINEELGLNLTIELV